MIAVIHIVLLAAAQLLVGKVLAEAMASPRARDVLREIITGQED